MKKISVLLADDHVLVRESIRKFLDEEDVFEVLGEAGDGEEAVQMAKQLQPQVLVMDIDMPKLNGIDAARQIKEHCPETAVLILTAYDYEQYIFALLDAGASGYLLKDVSGRDLVKSICEVSCGETVLHPAIARKVVSRFCGLNKQDKDYFEPLTMREKEVLIQAGRGIKNKEIAKQLYVSVRTIEAHLGHIFLKLGVTSRTEAVLVSLRKRLIRLDQL